MDRSDNPQTVLSFRGYLQAKLSEFVAGFRQSELTCELLAEFILVLSAYQEEGAHLFPPVFIAEDLNELLRVTGGLDPLLIGSGEQNRECVRRAFKQCAPLAEWREWAIFVALKKKTLTYGIFRADQSPLNPTPFERLRQSHDPRLRVIGLTRLGGDFVEVRSGTGLFQYVNMTGDQDGAGNPIELIRTFMRIVTENAPAEIRGQLQSFYYRIGVDLLHANHGTLVAVVHHERDVPAIFDDAVLLNPKLNVANGISAHLKTGSNDSFQQIFAWNQLIRRMTTVDGITVLDSSGAVVGYNCFIKNSALSKGKTVGGARRRAYEVLRSNLGDELLAVIYKSQDGVVELSMSR